MVQINFAQKTVNVKIVYYGPGMSGKTTNLEVIHQRAPESNRGDLTSISTDGDRTLFFDYMPLDLGTVGGMRTQFQIYTVPGQVYYNSTRKLVLQGTDGVIFVADSAASMLEQNLQSLRNLEENLNEYGKSLATLPHVIQFNKRDLPDAMSVSELEQHLNLHGGKTFEAIASSGQGVFPTLKSLAATVLKSIMEEAGETPRSTPRPAPAPTPAPTPAPAPAPAKPRAPVEEPAAPMPAANENPYEDAATHEPVAVSAGDPNTSATAMRQLQRKALLGAEERRTEAAPAKPARPRSAAAGSPSAAPSVAGAARRSKAAKQSSVTRRPIAPVQPTNAWKTPVAVGVAATLGAVGAWLVLNVLG
ncbi:MAG: ADP-ribosylation factor-like protein [Planctomycetota bacterium]